MDTQKRKIGVKDIRMNKNIEKFYDEIINLINNSEKDIERLDVWINYLINKHLIRIEKIRLIKANRELIKRHEINECFKYGSNKINSVKQVHKYIKKIKEKPKYCEICNEYKERLDLASINHWYTLFPKDYMYLCKSCHSLYDNLKGLRIFSRKQKDYTWNMKYKLGLSKERYYIVNSYILSSPESNCLELIPTQIVDTIVSKQMYYFFKFNEKKFIESIK